MKPKWKLIFNWYQNSIIVLTRHAIALSSWAVSITINSLIFFEAAPRQRRSVVRAPTRKPRVRSSNLGGEKAKNFPTWNICFTPFLTPIRVYYDPQKVWLQFIKVELYPSQKRGVPRMPIGRFFFKPSTLTACNFDASWPTETHSTSLERSQPPQQTQVKFRGKEGF